MSNLGLTQPPVQQSESQRAVRKSKVEARVHAGARWFYWIAGLSLVNTVIGMLGGGVHFVLGLGATQLVDAIGKQFGGPAATVALGVTAAIAAVFILLGMAAVKRGKKAFLGGMILYGLDGLLLILFQDWISIAFHAYALFALYGGLRALNELDAIDAAEAFDSSSAPKPA
jgi:hypothetical protein